MFISHLSQRYRLHQLTNTDNLVGKVIPLPILVLTIKLGIAQSIFFEWLIARNSGLCWESLNRRVLWLSEEQSEKTIFSSLWLSCSTF
ncbi:hypothetical protein BDV19DRAFT_61962 [Aspergillus venezuelensis]